MRLIIDLDRFRGCPCRYFEEMSCSVMGVCCCGCVVVVRPELLHVKPANDPHTLRAIDYPGAFLNDMKKRGWDASIPHKGREFTTLHSDRGAANDSICYGCRCVTPLCTCGEREK